MTLRGTPPLFFHGQHCDLSAFLQMRSCTGNPGRFHSSQHRAACTEQVGNYTHTALYQRCAPISIFMKCVAYWHFSAGRGGSPGSCVSASRSEFMQRPPWRRSLSLREQKTAALPPSCGSRPQSRLCSQARRSRLKDNPALQQDANRTTTKEEPKRWKGGEGANPTASGAFFTTSHGEQLTRDDKAVRRARSEALCERKSE